MEGQTLISQVTFLKNGRIMLKHCHENSQAPLFQHSQKTTVRSLKTGDYWKIMLKFLRERELYFISALLFRIFMNNLDF